MNNPSSIGLSGLEWTRAAYDYSVDAAQRSILFMDVLRKRGNIYFQHLKARQPPVLTFDYELLLDGRTLERPVNYALLRILDRRDPPLERKDDSVERRNNPVFRKGYPLERRHCPVERRGKKGTQSPPKSDQMKRPIIIIDPRAGHGPGIGGSKRDSEVGMALNNGHPVYFVIFYTDPIPGQSVSDVQKAQVHFVEEVVRRHPHAPDPAVIGNCPGRLGGRTGGRRSAGCHRTTDLQRITAVLLGRHRRQKSHAISRRPVGRCLVDVFGKRPGKRKI